VTVSRIYIFVYRLASFTSFVKVFTSIFSKCCFLQDIKLRSYAYIAVGRIGQRAPQQISKDLSLIQRLFEAMSRVSQTSTSVILFQV
jgi:Proteasome stabiliser